MISSPDMDMSSLLRVSVRFAVSLSIFAHASSSAAIDSLSAPLAFAMNSSLHSFLILAYSNDYEVALDVGFYYSANAAGRLVGTFLSGVLYLWDGLSAALWGSAAFVVATWLLTLRLPPLPTDLDISLATVEASD
jgi:predicted MFS family arabinose efflux permease